MTLKDAEQVVREVVVYVEQFRAELGRSERRRNCGQYLSGLILPGERKSIEPIADRVVESNAQSLQQFVNQSPWDEQPVQSLYGESWSNWLASVFASSKQSLR